MSLNCGQQRPYFSSPRLCVEGHGGMILTGEREELGVCRSVTLSTTNLTWIIFYPITTFFTVKIHVSMWCNTVMICAPVFTSMKMLCAEFSASCL
jgi:hypothetical protein